MQPRRNWKGWFCKIRKVNKVHYGKCEMVNKDKKYFLYGRQRDLMVNTSYHPAAPGLRPVPSTIAGFVLRPTQMQMDHACKKLQIAICNLFLKLPAKLSAFPRRIQLISFNSGPHCRVVSQLSEVKYIRVFFFTFLAGFKQKLLTLISISLV